MRSQESSAAEIANALYSASVEDRDIVFCFLADHEMGLGPRNTNNPVVERLSVGSPAQSASEKAVRIKGPGDKQIP